VSVSLESRVNALEQKTGGGQGIIAIRVLEVDVDGTEELIRTIYVDPVRNCIVPLPEQAPEKA
ncbi:MAG: hypothetical protein H0W29_12815, partial [Gemmatimonadales bacterium]|nr:hypothetical protein [Gemmatimonadales bacterium]